MGVDSAAVLVAGWAVELAVVLVVDSGDMAERGTPSQEMGGDDRVRSSIRGHQKSWIMMIGTLNFNIFTFLKVVC